MRRGGQADADHGRRDRRAVPGTSAGMGFQVTEVQSALKGAEYPADGDKLAGVAEGNGADSAIVDALRGMREVDGPNGVMKELKGELGGPTD